MLIRVDHKLRIALKDLPPDVLHLIKDALSIPNIERQKAMEQNLWGWQEMADTIQLWAVKDSDLVMPRGFWLDLAEGLRHYEVHHRLDDQRCDEPTPEKKGERINLLRWQMPAVEAILHYQQGIWKAPAGAGKTVGVLEAIRRSDTPSIVLVNTKDILYQWQDRAKTFLGADFPVSVIGDGKIEISDYLTIATAQTLHRRFDEFERSGFFDDHFGFMCLDESHHATADTFNRIVDRFSSKIRIGVSATPDKTGDFELATKVLGPIFHRTLHENVDSILKPHVFKISTNFQFGYRGVKGNRPSNYPQLLKALTTNEERNNLIVRSILMNPGSHSLVISKRIEHLRIIADKLNNSGYQYKIMMLTGKESSEIRKDVIDYATHNPCVILSTLADEALDIPRLDSIFLVFPQRNPGLIEQQVGRVCRIHPDKQGANVYDFADPLVGPLDNQWKVRRRDVYQPHRYEITVVNPSEILEYELE